MDTLMMQLKPALPYLRMAQTPAYLLVLLLSFYHISSGVYHQFLAPAFEPLPIATKRPGIGERWTWFSPQAVEKPKIVQEKITESRLNAKLLGIIEKPSGSVAIIDTGKKKESKVFREGDKITRSVSVHKIEADRVLIKEQGAIRSLTMESKRSDQITAVALSNNASDNRAALKRNPALSGVAFIQTQNGDVGLSLNSINPRMLQGTTLRANDVVLNADGNAVNEILDSPDSYKSMLSRDSLDITILRDGQEQTININPRAIAPNVMRLIGNQNR